jgi:hypothetical protein
LDTNLVCVVAVVTVGIVAVVAVYFGRWFHASADGAGVRLDAATDTPARPVAKKQPRRGKRRGGRGRRANGG